MPHNTTVRNGAALNQSEFENEYTLNSVIIDYLRQLLEGGELRVGVKVSLDGSNSESTAVNLKTLHLRVNNKIILSENFDNQTPKWIVAGESINIPSMEIACVSALRYGGLFRAHTYNEIPNQASGIVMATDTGFDSSPYEQTIYQINLTYDYRSLSFWLTWKARKASIVFFDESGVETGSFDYPEGNPQNILVQSTAPENRRIKSIRVTTHDNCYLDFFRFGL